jgi:hypothetical protein
MGQYQIEKLHADFCKNILYVQQKTPNNAEQNWFINADYQNPENNLQPKRKQFPNLPQSHHLQRDEPGEESPKQAGPGP